ncbi:MAG: hypothetical protein IKC64_03520 [Clostridia bacterium]|nr:hypothetical protein [Clostridia bacterium]
MDELERLLDYCESVADENAIAEKIENQKKCLKFEEVSRPVIKIGYSSPDFKPYSMEEIHADMGKMLYNEMLGALPQLETNDGGVPRIRANYGVGILPSVFGAECRIINGNMPWCDHFDEDGIAKILKSGVPNLMNGFGQKIKDTHAFYIQTLSKYPKLSKVVKIYHPDFQGPFDVAHLLYGSEIYYQFYEEPELLHELLSLVTETYVASMKEIKSQICDTDGEFVYHWGHLFPGSVVLRDDSAVNLSADMYDEFVRPYNDKVLSAFGSGSVHFCGRADHWVFDMANDELIKGYNVGYMNTLTFGMEYLDFIKSGYYDQRKSVVGYNIPASEVEIFDFNKYKTGVTYNINLGASTKEKANEILNEIYNK